MIEPANNNCQRCDAEHRRAEAIRVDLENAETELRIARRRETALRTELRKHLEEDAGAAEIKEILAEWKIICGHQRAKTPLDGARAKAVRRMLKVGYTADQLKKAIHGCGRFPYVGPHGRVTDGTQKDRHDDLTLILRDESTVDRFIGYADRPVEAGRDNVVSIQSAGSRRAERETKAKLETVSEMLTEALRQVRELRRVVEIQQDMIVLDAQINDRLLAELEQLRDREEVAA
jgi:hypothetical protein